MGRDDDDRRDYKRARCERRALSHTPGAAPRCPHALCAPPSLTSPCAQPDQTTTGTTAIGASTTTIAETGIVA
eukprot:1084324-Prymnesium_polylepis.1